MPRVGEKFTFDQSWQEQIGLRSVTDPHRPELADRKESMGSNQGWKQFERRCSRDVGVERIPVTGERHGADAATSLFCFQFKLRNSLPDWLWEWLGGIVANAETNGKVGVLVLKKPRQQDADALVVLRWKDWVALHGEQR